MKFIVTNEYGSQIINDCSCEGCSIPYPINECYWIDYVARAHIRDCTCGKDIQMTDEDILLLKSRECRNKSPEPSFVYTPTNNSTVDDAVKNVLENMWTIDLRSNDDE